MVLVTALALLAGSGAQGVAHADEAAPTRPGAPAREPSLGPDPSGDAARRARERTITHGELESRRARQRLERIDRQQDAAARAEEAARPRPRTPLERERSPREPLPLRTDRRLDLDREISEVDRWLARPDLGPATRSAIERYRRELEAERSAPEAAPRP